MDKLKNRQAQKFGDEVEAATQGALELLQKGPERWFYQRLYDTRSAGSFLPPMPADFLGISGGRGFSLEVKGSMKYKSLRDPGALREMVSSAQALGGYMVGRAGGLSLILFVSKTSQVLEVWDASKVRETYVTPRAKLTGCEVILQEFIPDLGKLQDAIKWALVNTLNKQEN